MVLEKKKTMILNDHKLDQYDVNPSKIFTCAMQKYMKASPEFDDIFKKVEAYHQKVMISIFKGTDTVEPDTLKKEYALLVNSELDKYENT